MDKSVNLMETEWEKMTYEFENQDEMRLVCGVNDANIVYIEGLLGVSLSVRGTKIESVGENRILNMLLDNLVQLSRTISQITEKEILLEYRSLEINGSEEQPDSEKKYIKIGTRCVYPKGRRQEEYIDAIQKNQIVFSCGPAGTGKTFIAISYCLGELLSGRKQKIILTRPVVEAGESLGFLPGDLSQKLNPYLRPLYDSMEASISPSTISRLEESGAIETAPLAYMRGRSIHNACIILDEAQNTTISQMKMFLTRIGENSKAIITGDLSQTDLPARQESGLAHASGILRNINGISFVDFTSSDTVRSRIVQRILDAYDSKK